MRGGAKKLTITTSNIGNGTSHALAVPTFIKYMIMKSGSAPTSTKINGAYASGLTLNTEYPINAVVNTIQLYGYNNVVELYL